FGGLFADCLANDVVERREHVGRQKGPDTPIESHREDGGRGLIERLSLLHDIQQDVQIEHQRNRLAQVSSFVFCFRSFFHSLLSPTASSLRRPPGVNGRKLPFDILPAPPLSSISHYEGPATEPGTATWDGHPRCPLAPP